MQQEKLNALKDVIGARIKRGIATYSDGTTLELMREFEKRNRLADAAPDLLDVAKTIVAICEGGKYADLACMEGSPLVDAAREAIAKATGTAA